MALLTANSFPHRATIRRRKRYVDSLGGSNDSADTVATNVPCWKQLASASEIGEFNKRSISVTDKIYFLTDLQLTTEHFIVINDQIFEVRTWAGPDASAGLGVLFRAMAEYAPGGITSTDLN